MSLRGRQHGHVDGLSAFASAVPAFLLGVDGTRIGAANADTLVVLAFSGGAAYLVTNVMLVAIAVTLAQGVPLRRMSHEYMSHSGPAFMAFISALAVSLWKVNPTLGLLAGPLFALALYATPTGIPPAPRPMR